MQTKIKELKQEIINKAKQEAENIVQSANKMIEKTIREIRKNQAEKEKTKELRKKFEEEKQKLLSHKNKKDKIETRLKNLEQKKAPTKQEFVKIDKSELRVGDKVKMLPGENIGEIIELNKNKAIVAFGNLLTQVKTEQLKKISNNEFKKNTKKTTSNISNLTLRKRANFQPNIDVRGMRVDEALVKVSHFIDEAVMFGFSDLKILHGTGTGALRVAIRNYLKTFQFVNSIKDEHIEFGGAGITVVKLKI